MKKILLLLLPGMLFLAGNAEAQLQKGTVHFGATISADGSAFKSKATSSPSKDKSTSNAHTISPALQTGWMIKDNRMFGLRLTSLISLRKTKYENAGPGYVSNTNFTSLSLSPFIRQYKPINAKWALFLQSGVEGSYLWSKSKVDESVDKEDGYSAGLYILPGITYWVSPRFAIETDLQLLSLGINYTKFDDEWKTFNFNAGITSNINNYFGVRAVWYFQKSN